MKRVFMFGLQAISLEPTDYFLGLIPQGIKVEVVENTAYVYAVFSTGLEFVTSYHNPPPSPTVWGWDL